MDGRPQAPHRSLTEGRQGMELFIVIAVVLVLAALWQVRSALES
jgi:hypothetical protein